MLSTINMVKYERAIENGILFDSTNEEKSQSGYLLSTDPATIYHKNNYSFTCNTYSNTILHH